MQNSPQTARINGPVCKSCLHDATNSVYRRTVRPYGCLELDNNSFVYGRRRVVQEYCNVTRLLRRLPGKEDSRDRHCFLISPLVVRVVTFVDHHRFCTRISRRRRRNSSADENVGAVSPDRSNTVPTDSRVGVD